MSQLQLSLLGEPLVKHDERTLTFSTRKALALLVYLAVEGGMHTRKILSEAFWPELDAEHGRAALRATLLELRRLLDGSHAPGEPAHLVVERDMLGVEQGNSLLLDLRLVEAASKQVERWIDPLVGEGREALLAQLEQATGMSRGPFLAGFTLRDSQFFDDWTRQERESWHLRLHLLFDALSMLYERVGDAERAIETVTRWLSFDPLTEEGYRRLMRLRFSQGDRAGALRAYANGRAVLAEQLQVEPEPETVALATHIRHNAPLWSPQVRRLQPSRTSPGEPPTHLLDSPFRGRAAEFGTLIECYLHAQAGQPQLVLLQGETGIGKTRLASEFLGWAQAQGADVLVGEALNTERQLPYQPLIDVLRLHLEQEPAPGDLLSAVWLAELSRLLPELHDRHPELPVPATDEALGHNRLFEAIARLVQTWAARRPLVLLLDDMQWADTATLDLLVYLARSLADEGAQVLLLLSARTGAGSFTSVQSTWVMALKQSSIRLTALVLAAFTQEETQHFVQELAWGEQPAELGNNNGATEGSREQGEASTVREALAPFANWLYFQTQGQPLYLVETLKGLLARGIIVPVPQGKGSWGLALRTGLLGQIPVGELIPSSVRELIRSQLERLTPSARALLVAGAALGQGLTFERLIQMVELDEREGLHALEELLRNGLLCEGTRVEEGQVLGDYAFPREMTREVVYQEAGVTRQRLVQRRVLAVMREEAGDDPGEEAHPLRPDLIDRHALVEARNGQRRRVVAGVVSRDMRGMGLADKSAVGGVGTINRPLRATGRHANAGPSEKTSLAAWERWAAGHAAPALPRSPPGSPARAFFETH